VVNGNFGFASELLLAAIKTMVHMNNMNLPPYAPSWSTLSSELW